MRANLQVVREGEAVRVTLEVKDGPVIPRLAIRFGTGSSATWKRYEKITRLESPK